MPRKAKKQGVVGERIGQLCVQRNLTIKDFYQHIRDYYEANGMKPPALSTIYTWQNGQRTPSKNSVAVMSRIFNVPASYFISEALDESETDRATEEQTETYIDLSTLPQECLKSVKAVERTIVMPTGQKMRIISIKDGIAIPEGDSDNGDKAFV